MRTIDGSSGQLMNARKLLQWKGGVPPKWLVLCGPLVLSAGFSLYPVVIKYYLSQASEKANPYIFTFYRDLGAVPVLFGASYFIEGRIPIPKREMGLILLMLGFVGTFLSHFLYISGAFNLPPDIASAIMSLVPVSTSIVSILMCTEALPSPCVVHSWAKVIGITVAVGGAIHLALVGNEPEPKEYTNFNRQLFGSVCLFVDTVVMALFFALQKKFIFKRRDCRWKDYPIAVTAYGYLFGTVFMGLSLQYYVFTGQIKLFSIPNQSLPALFYGIFVTSALCYFLLTWSNKYLPSTVMTAFRPIQVVGTVIAAYIMFGDTLTYTQCLAALLAIVGVVLVLYSNWVEESLSEGGTALTLDKCFKSVSSFSRFRRTIYS